MADTLFRDGNNNLGQLKTLTASDSSILPQSSPSDSTGKPFGTANPLPVTVAGVAEVQMLGQGPQPVTVSVSVTEAQPPENPDFPISIGGAGLGAKLDQIIFEMKLFNLMFAQETGIDIDIWRQNLIESCDPDSAGDLSSSTSSYTN